MLLRWFIIFAFFSGAVAAQTLPRTDSGKPDLQGIWQAQHTSAAADLQVYLASQTAAGSSTEVPYLPAALATKLANFTNRAVADPLNSCFFPGVPRLMFMEYPYQIFQTDEHVAITFEWSQVYRLIYTNGQPTKYPGIESWMGNSRGYWEGDELVVEINDLNDKTWFDATGNFHSNTLRLTERYHMVDMDTIDYSITIDDPAVYSKPWTIRMPLQRQKDLVRLMEYQCQAEKEELSGDFERDERTWYPAAIPVDNAPFDATASIAQEELIVATDVPRLADGKPDIGGYFMADGRGANYGLETSAENRPLTPNARGVIVDPTDGILPYQTWARAEHNDRVLPQRGYDDPTAHCFVAGVPRSNYVPSPFQILQTPDNIVVLHERMAWRQIFLDGRAHLPDDQRLWQGDSTGKWQGDTLLVETTNLNGKTWLNEAGDVVSHMQTVVETFTPINATEIIYRATVSDPIAYTRPWTMQLVMSRQNDELLEVACHEDNGDLQHLKDVRDEYRAAQTQEN